MFPKLSGKGLQRIALPLALWFSCLFTIQADDWPNWSGAYHDGISRETDFSDTWPKEGLPIEWTREIGTGFSSVSVAGQRLFAMGHSPIVEKRTI